MASDRDHQLPSRQCPVPTPSMPRAGTRAPRRPPQLPAPPASGSAQKPPRPHPCSPPRRPRVKPRCPVPRCLGATTPTPSLRRSPPSWSLRSHARTSLSQSCSGDPHKATFAAQRALCEGTSWAGVLHGTPWRGRLREGQRAGEGREAAPQAPLWQGAAPSAPASLPQCSRPASAPTPASQSPPPPRRPGTALRRGWECGRLGPSRLRLGPGGPCPGTRPPLPG